MPRFFAALMVSLVVSNPAARSPQTQSRVPDLTLRVGVQQKEGGRVNKGIHILKLACYEGDCTLTSVSVNQCGDMGFPAVVESSSTRDRTLKVTNVGNALRVDEVSTDIGGTGTATYQFGYRLERHGAVLTSFSGGFMKHSDLLNRVVTVEYVPFKGLIQAVKLDCPLLVPGVAR